MQLEGKSAAGLEERQQQGGAGLGLDTGGDLDAMVEAAIAQQVVHAARSPRLVVPGAEDHAWDARVQDGAGAHDTRLERHHQGEVGEVPVTASLGGRANRHDLRVRGRVLVLFAFVTPHRNESAGRVDQQRRDRHIAGLEGRPCLGERFAHPFFVSGHVSSVR